MHINYRLTKVLFHFSLQSVYLIDATNQEKRASLSRPSFRAIVQSVMFFRFFLNAPGRAKFPIDMRSYFPKHSGLHKLER